MLQQSLICVVLFNYDEVSMGRETHSFNYACSCLKSKCRRSCWLDIKASNLSKKVLLHCKNYTSVIKVTNLFLSSSPPPPPPLP